MFGRQRLTINQLAEAYDNTETIMGMLAPCHTELEVTITLLEESNIRTRALLLLERLGNEMDGLCADRHEMCEFWQHYGAIFGRSAFTELEMRRGLDMFEYWTEGGGWRQLAWSLREEVLEMLEVSKEHIWHRHRLAGPG